MQIYALRMYNFFRFGEKDNSVVLDLSPEEASEIASNNLTLDQLYDQIAKNPSNHIRSIDEKGITNLIAIAGMSGNDFDKSNGTGKSTVLEAICYLLYDRIVRKTANTEKVGDAGVDVVSKINDQYPADLKESFVEGIIKENGKIYRVKRGRIFTSGYKNHKPVLEVDSYSENNTSSESGHRKADTADALAKIINYDYDVFVNSAMFGQNDAGKFLIGTDKTRKEMLINVLRLENVVTGCLNEIRFRKNNKEKDVLELETKHALFKKSIEEHATPETLQEQINKAQKDIANIEGEISQLTKDVEVIVRSEKASKIAEIKEEGRKVVLEIKAQEEQLSLQTQEWTQLAKQANQVIESSSLETTKLQKDIDSNKSSIDLLSAKIQQFNLAEKQEDLKKAMQAQSLQPKYTSFLAESRKRLEKIIEDIGQIRSDISRYNKELMSLQDQIANVSGDEFVCSKCKSKVTKGHITKEITEVQKNTEDCQKKLSVLELSKKEIDSEITDLQNKVEKINKWMIRKSQIESEIEGNERNKVRVKEVQEMLAKSSEQIEKLTKQIEENQLKKSEYAVKIDKIKAKYEKDLKLLNDKKNSLVAKFKDMDKEVEVIKNQINSLESKKKVLSKNKDDLNTKIGSWRKEIQNYTDTLKQVETLAANLAIEKKVFERLLRLEDVFGLEGIQTRIVSKYLPLLNAYIKEFLDVLSQGEMTVEIFINERSKIDMDVKGNSASSFVLLSGGEKMIVRLAVDIGLALLSFSRCAQKPEIICLDEIFGPLDDFHISTVFELIRKLQSRFSRVLLISHKDEINRHIKHHLVVEKTPGDLGRSRIRNIS